MTDPSPSHYRLWRTLRPLGNLAAAAISIVLAFWLRVVVPLPWTLGLMPASRLHFLCEFFLLFLALQPLVLYFFGLYDRPQTQARLGLVRRLSTAVVAQGATLTAIFFLADRIFPRSVLVVYVALDFSFLLAWRLLLQRHYRQPRRRVAIVGRGPRRERSWKT